jgi:hypothetical protein
MVSQFALPRSTREFAKRKDVQDVGFITEAAQNAPRLGRYLADALEAAGKSAPEIFKQTGWSKDIDGVWHYEYGDQAMKVREDNPNLNIQKESFQEDKSLSQRDPGYKAMTMRHRAFNEGRPAWRAGYGANLTPRFEVMSIRRW